jgi:hypothetical protein
VDAATLLNSISSVCRKWRRLCHDGRLIGCLLPGLTVPMVGKDWYALARKYHSCPQSVRTFALFCRQMEISVSALKKRVTVSCFPVEKEPVVKGWTYFLSRPSDLEKDVAKYVNLFGRTQTFFVGGVGGFNADQVYGYEVTRHTVDLVTLPSPVEFRTPFAIAWGSRTTPDEVSFWRWFHMLEICDHVNRLSKPDSSGQICRTESEST